MESAHDTYASGWGELRWIEIEKTRRGTTHTRPRRSFGHTDMKTAWTTSCLSLRQSWTRRRVSAGKIIYCTCTGSGMDTAH